MSARRRTRSAKAAVDAPSRPVVSATSSGPSAKISGNLLCQGISELKTSTSSAIDSVRKEMENSHSSISKDLESATARLTKRIKLDTQVCTKHAEDLEQQFKKFKSDIDEDFQEIKDACEDICSKMQSSSAQFSKKAVVELLKSAQASLDGLRSRYVTS